MEESRSLVVDLLRAGASWPSTRQPSSWERASAHALGRCRLALSRTAGPRPPPPHRARVLAAAFPLRALATASAPRRRRFRRPRAS
ncbi:Os03g0427201 [Oryza sativa Japonica Group]|uniref:Os03g0427201 protein n=1 Tax=Oryza sativa subsp. japonica TaxID=39947 RepID=A0A0P0VZ10_ORYSJ|nr:Os03g0427201 [Oryza sativa Japonica Group]